MRRTALLLCLPLLAPVGGRQAPRRRLGAFGAEEGDARPLVDYSKVDASDCRIKEYPMPDPRSGMPLLQDVWASPEGDVVHFIAQNQCLCYPPGKQPSFCRFGGSSRRQYTCTFADRAGNDAAEPVCASPVRFGAEVHTYYFTCPIPKRGLKSSGAGDAEPQRLARNSGAAAQLFVRVGINEAGGASCGPRPSTNGGVSGWERVPVCATPIANYGQLVPILRRRKQPAAPAAAAPLRSVLRGSDVPGAAAQRRRPGASATKKRYFLSACLFTTSDPYFNEQNNWIKGDNVDRLPEWLEFHLLVGFEHFYVYDNSEKPHGPVYVMLKPFLKRGLATYHHWPHRNCKGAASGTWIHQYGAGNACARRYAPESEWIADIDEDEYMVPNQAHLGLTTVPAAMRAQLGGSLTTTVDAISVLMHYYGDCRFLGMQPGAMKGAPPPANHSRLFLDRHSCPAGNGGMEARNKLLMRTDGLLLHRVHSATVAHDGGTAPRVILNTGGAQAATDSQPMHAMHTQPLRLVHAKTGFFESVLNGRPLAPPDAGLRQYWLPRLQKRLAVDDPGEAKVAAALDKAEAAEWAADIKKANGSGPSGTYVIAIAGTGGSRPAGCPQDKSACLRGARFLGIAGSPRLMKVVGSLAEALPIRLERNPHAGAKGHCYWLKDVTVPGLSSPNFINSIGGSIWAHSDWGGDHLISYRYSRLDEASCFVMQPPCAAAAKSKAWTLREFSVEAKIMNRYPQLWTVSGAPPALGSKVHSASRGGRIMGETTVGHTTVASPHTQFVLLEVQRDGGATALTAAEEKRLAAGGPIGGGLCPTGIIK